MIGLVAAVVLAVCFFFMSVRDSHRHTGAVTTAFHVWAAAALILAVIVL